MNVTRWPPDPPHRFTRFSHPETLAGRLLHATSAIQPPAAENGLEIVLTVASGHQ